MVVNADGVSCDGRFGAGGSLLILGPSFLMVVVTPITVVRRSADISGGHSFACGDGGVRKYS